MKLLTLLMLGAAMCLGQTDPSDPGPLPVSNTQYNFEGQLIPQVPYPVDIWGTVWHPEDLSGGPYPLIIMLHGNHGVCRQPGTQIDLAFSSPPPPGCPPGFIKTPNHLGYDYVAARLAGYGYIVVSISANAINVRFNGNPERGRLVQEHLRYWAAWNSGEGGFPFGKTFSGKVNLQNVGLMGHSRGGDGVRAAYFFNRRDGGQFGIKAVFEIGPVDFGRIASQAQPVFDADNVAWSVLLPACDRDVSDNQGMRAYDRTRVIPDTTNRSAKSQIYVLGTNHNHYNSEWTPEDTLFRCIDFPVITQRPDQEQLSMTYMMGFFRTYLGGEDFKYLFSGDRKPPGNIVTPVLTSYTESPNDILVVDNFGERNSPDGNSAGGNNTMANIDIKRCSSNECNEPPPGSYFHDQEMSVAKIAWPQSTTSASTETPRITFHMGAAGRNVSAMNWLALRVASQFSLKNRVGENQNFSVRLVDTEGAMSNLVSVGEYRAIPYPTGSLFRISVLNTVRLPLSEFRGVNKSQIAAVQLVFDKTREGAIFLTDVHLSPR